MPDPREVEQRLQEEERKELCQGRCQFLFQPVITDTRFENGSQREYVDEAIVVCTTCTATKDIFFQHDKPKIDKKVTSEEEL